MKEFELISHEDLILGDVYEVIRTKRTGKKERYAWFVCNEEEEKAIEICEDIIKNKKEDFILDLVSLKNQKILKI